MAQRILQSRTFHFFITVNDLQSLIVPDQFSIICQAALPNIRIFLRIKGEVPSNAFNGCLLPKVRFGIELIRSHVAPLPNLRMVYVCGTQEMYRAIIFSLESCGINKERIFLV